MTTGRINQISTVSPLQAKAFPPTRALGSAYLGLGFRHILQREICPTLFFTTKSFSQSVSTVLFTFHLIGLRLSVHSHYPRPLSAEEGLREISLDNLASKDQNARPISATTLPTELYASVEGVLP